MCKDFTQQQVHFPVKHHRTTTIMGKRTSRIALNEKNKNHLRCFHSMIHYIKRFLVIET